MKQTNDYACANCLKRNINARLTLQSCMIGLSLKPGRMSALELTARVARFRAGNRARPAGYVVPVIGRNVITFRSRTGPISGSVELCFWNDVILRENGPKTNANHGYLFIKRHCHYFKYWFFTTVCSQLFHPRRESQ